MLELSTARLGVLLATFVIAGVYDWSSREIPVKTWVPAIVLGIVLDVVEVLLGTINIMYLIPSAIIVAVIFYMCTKGMIGGADMLAVITIVTLLPQPPKLQWALRILPPLITLITYYGFFTLLLVVLNLLANSVRMSIIKSVPAPLYKKLILALSSRPMKVSKFLNTKFYYPVYIPGNLFRLHFSVEEDDSAWRAKIRELIAKGVLREDSEILVTWGIPTVTLLAVAVVLYIAVGDWVLLKVFEFVLRTRL